MTAKHQTGQETARRAAKILIDKRLGFVVPTARQKQNILMAFAGQGKVVYGRAFDIVRLSGAVDMNDLGNLQANLQMVTVFEIKSTRKKVGPRFSGYFFALTAAELLVAQSLKRQFRFVFVNTKSGEHCEMTLSEILSKAKGIYPTWSISF